MSGKAMCKGCQREVHPVRLINGYCEPCSDELREMLDYYDAVRPLDGDSYDDVHWDEIEQELDNDEGGEA